jgi:hypothetical protein
VPSTFDFDAGAASALAGQFGREVLTTRLTHIDISANSKWREPSLPGERYMRGRNQEVSGAVGFTRALGQARLNGRASPWVRQVEASVGWSDLSHELERSRRYRHHFVIVRISSERPADEALALAQVVRTIDGVWADGPHVYLLLRESDRTMADALLARLSSLFPHIFAKDVQMAAFPEDGVTRGALLACLATRPPGGIVDVGEAHDGTLLDSLAPQGRRGDVGLALEEPE